MTETDTYGLDKVRDEQQELGDKVRALMASYGFKSLAADGYGAPGRGGLLHRRSRYT